MKYDMVVIGSSLGGLQATRAVLSVLPAGYPLPLALVQHRSPDAGDELTFVLRQSCVLTVRDAMDKDAIRPGTVYIAPPGYHLLVEDGHFALSTEPPVLNAQPSIDVLFESAVESCGPRLIGVILTGTGRDGAQGLAAVASCGGCAIVEEPESAYARELPQAASEAAQGERRLHLEEIGPYLIELGKRK